MSDQHESSEVPTNHAHDGSGGAPWRRRGPLTRFAFLIVFAIVIAAIAFVGETLGHSRGASGATISVTGSGTVRGTPNTMSFEIGVQTTAATATAALDANNAQVYKLETSLLNNGITKKNLQTSDLNIYTNTNNNGQITGFTAEDDLNVTTHDMKKAGAALDAAAHAVGNGIQLNGVTFSISNQSKLLASARARAIENAHTEASQLAKGAGTTLGSIAKVTDEENNGTTGIVYPVAQALGAFKSSVPIESGSQSINVQVEVIYNLNN